MARTLADQNNQNNRTKRTILSSNPIMRRLEKVQEVSETNSCTYGGITLKTTFFLLFSVVGIVLQVLLEKSLYTGEAFSVTISGFEVALYTGETIALVAALVLGIVFQLLAFFVKATTPVTGALYCVTQGYFISFLVFKVLGAYQMEYLGALALAITMLIILVMSILYTKGIIRVTKKFKMVMLTLVFTMVGISVLTLIASFIPATKGIVSAIQNNFLISILMTVGFIIIAALFLICDFNTIDEVVTNQMPKKYEWQAAFGLSFTVLWLYLKVLDLIMTIAGNNRD